jgi:murein DD-endopeptidase MepM/ murein hydrolase activator NlpD
LALTGGLGVLALAAAVAISAVPPDSDPVLEPTQIVTERVHPVEVHAQLEALANLDLELTFSEVTRAGTTLEATLRRLGVADPETLAALRSDKTLQRALNGKAGRVVQSRVTASGELSELVVRMPAEDSKLTSTHFTRLTLRPGPDGWQSQLEQLALGTTTRLASGTIASSLFAATDDAQIPDAVAVQIAEIFSADIDFHRELRKGDTFSVVYEALTADGEPIPWSHGTGRVLAGEFINQGRTHQAIWFEQDGKGAYFDPSGRSRKRAFLASPLEFSRVSSGFAMRMHPILQRMTAHKGVDYAAPSGTPVRVVGDGTVQFAGWQNGYGKVVHVLHGRDKLTVYAHLSRVDVRKGQRVDQGQRIGAVGATGWATGPHLHFEFRIGGVHKDPRTIAKAAESIELAGKSKVRFAQVARAVGDKLDLAAASRGAPAFE